MNMDNIEAFLYAFQLGSFNKAAEALYLTQPSVTARIQSLERELKGPLFHRDGKQITLTERGKQFLPYAQKNIASLPGDFHYALRTARDGEKPHHRVYTAHVHPYSPGNSPDLS